MVRDVPRLRVAGALAPGSHDHRVRREGSWLRRWWAGERPVVLHDQDGRFLFFHLENPVGFFHGSPLLGWGRESAFVPHTNTDYQIKHLNAIEK